MKPIIKYYDENAIQKGWEYVDTDRMGVMRQWIIDGGFIKYDNQKILTLKQLREIMTSIVKNPTGKKRKMSTAERMKYIRSFRKSKKRPASKTVTKRKSRKRFIRSMKEISRPVVKKKNPESDRSMRAAHLRVSTLIIELGKRKKVTADFDQSDKFWLMYILKKI